jgi:hypothetical protein
MTTSFTLLTGQPLKPIFEKINANVLLHGRAYENLKDITETIGHRLTGSDNGRRAEEYAYRLFQQYGYKNVNFQEFKTEAWSRKSVSLTIKGGSANKDYPVVSLAHSPVSAHVSGDIIDLGDGLTSDFEAAGQD